MKSNSKLNSIKTYNHKNTFDSSIIIYDCSIEYFMYGILFYNLCVFQ